MTQASSASSQPAAFKPTLPEVGIWPSMWQSQAWWHVHAASIHAWQTSSKVSTNEEEKCCGKASILPNPFSGWVAHQLNQLKAQTPKAQAADWPQAFVPQAHLPADQAYEAFIHASGRVPTRDNWHDLLNALTWLRLPHTKRQLNRLQAAEIAQHGVQAKRGPVRDACTVFDENAALLFAPDALWQALQERRWGDLFGPLRPLWQEAQVLVFGHAALEKLLTPYKSITVHVWRVPMAWDVHGDLHELDAWLAKDLLPSKLAQKPFCPLPILGVPNWWPANASPEFYADPTVFRAARRPSLSS